MPESEEEIALPIRQKNGTIKRMYVIEDSDCSDTEEISNKMFDSEYCGENIEISDVSDIRKGSCKSTETENKPATLVKSKNASHDKSITEEEINYLSDSSSSLEGYIQSLQKITGDPENVSGGKICKIPTKESCEKENIDENIDAVWIYDKTRNDYYLNRKLEKTKFPNFRLPISLYDKLYDFQRVAVQWIVSLHCHRAVGNMNISPRLCGGILADDMGMGKTFVSLSVLGGLMRGGMIKNALVIAPLSVLRNWENEAKKILLLCSTKIRIYVVSSAKPERERRRVLYDATTQRHGTFHLIITTFGLVRSSERDFLCTRSSGTERKWDYVIIDEAHNIKNPNASITQSCHTICQNPQTRRLLLSGTPILNNLSELWCLFDFVTRGAILGPMKEFKQSYAIPIEEARDSSARDAAVELGERKNRELQELLKPYFLQRLKVDYLKDKLPPKVEVVVWTHLSKRQRELYDEFLQSNNHVYSILRGEKISPLVAIAELKKLCSHPLLLEGEPETETKRFVTVDDMVSLSAKLGVLLSMVQELRTNHRTLIFSQSTKMLDIIERALRNERVSLLRIDGSTKEQDRQKYVDDFNGEFSDIEVMLLSTKAAGVGLTLTGADTVIVYDPSWTPAEDSQAVDRAYRLGQHKPVNVYRLIAAGTVEEKMYERQIHKDGIRRTVFGVEGKSVQRYFEKNELKDLFKLAPAGECQVMEKVHQAMHGRNLDWEGHKFVLSLDGVVGLSRHDGFYYVSDRISSGEKKAFDEPSMNNGTELFVGPLGLLQPSQTNNQMVNDKRTKSTSERQKRKTGIEITGEVRVLMTSLLQRMTDAEKNSKPKLALKLGIDLLELSRHGRGDNRLEIHENVSAIANSLGLLQID